VKIAVGANWLHSAAFFLFLGALTFIVLSYALLTSVTFPSTYTSPSPEQPSSSCSASGQCKIGLTDSIGYIGATITTPNALLWQASRFLKMVADFLDLLALIILPSLFFVESSPKLVQWLARLPIPTRRDR
jgi:hypothetical protein